MVYCSQFVVLADFVDNVVFHVTIIVIQLTESLLLVVAPDWFYVDRYLLYVLKKLTKTVVICRRWNG